VQKKQKRGRSQAERSARLPVFDKLWYKKRQRESTNDECGGFCAAGTTG
jgi:hypothetical protein